jgi:hypothetical protein
MVVMVVAVVVVVVVWVRCSRRGEDAQRHGRESGNDQRFHISILYEAPELTPLNAHDVVF